jgi:malonyl-CoA O-methyltransferase
MSPNVLEPAHAYDLWADTYDTAPNPMIALSGEVLAQHDIVLSRVLELGCSTGRNLIALKDRGAVVIAGVDMSEGMLAVARRRNSEATFWRQDARIPLQTAASSFDVVLVSLVLEHIAPPSLLRLPDFSCRVGYYW